MASTNRHPDTDLKPCSDSRTDGKGIVIMTTQVTLSDDVTRVRCYFCLLLPLRETYSCMQTLTRLGVKFTTKPTECTHLVAKAIVRTEKFLCAMSVAPYVVTDKWVEACAIKRKILRMYNSPFLFTPLLTFSRSRRRLPSQGSSHREEIWFQVGRRSRSCEDARPNAIQRPDVLRYAPGARRHQVAEGRCHSRRWPGM